MSVITTFEELVRHRFRSKRQGSTNLSWYPMTCRTAAKFLKSQGINVRIPRPGYEIDVKKDRGVRTILTNRGGRCEFTFYYGNRWSSGQLPLDGARKRKR